MKLSNDSSMYRTPSLGMNGIVVSGHPLATWAGLNILRRGGNAVDAAIATSSVLSVVLPSQNGIGGDFFALYYESSSGKVYFLNASGYSGSRAKYENLPEENGKKVLPVESPYSITVPGITYGWYLLSKHATMEYDDLLSQAIDYAENGFPVSYHLSLQIKNSREKLLKNNFLRKNFLEKEFGDFARNIELSKVLKRLIDNPLDIYNGITSEEISKYLEEIGSFVTEDDLKNYSAFWDKPLNMEYRGYQVYETPPNTQGIAALIAFKHMENYDMKSMNEWERVNTMVQGIIKGFYVREKVTDPKFMSENVEEYINKEIKNESKTLKIDGDTVSFSVADKNGNALSCIQSLYYPFGSGYADMNTGIIFQNRGAYFSLQKGHVNFIEPRKRTLHTLTAGMLFGEDFSMFFSAAGGNGQPQTHVQIISNIVDRNMNPQESVEYPRFVYGRVLLEDDDSLKLENDFSQETMEKLRSMGYKIKIVEKLNDLMGDANVILKKGKVLMGGSDPRRDSMGMGY